MVDSFWLGFWALPLGALALAVALLLLFGSWLALEKWAERRFVRKNPHWARDEQTGEEWIDDDGDRPNAAMLVLLAPHVTQLRLFFGAHLLIVRGTQHISRRTAIRQENKLSSELTAAGPDRKRRN